MNKKQMLKEQKRMKKERQEASQLFQDDKEVYNVFKIALGVIIFFVLAYLFVNIANGNWNIFSKKNTNQESFDSQMVMVGTMFNKSDEEYLVLAYDLKDDNQTFYSALSDEYNGSKKLYILDLSSGFNASFIGDETVVSNDLTKLKLSSPILLVIKGNDILSSYKDESSIKNDLEGQK